jgi:hypothetical protein
MERYNPYNTDKRKNRNNIKKVLQQNFDNELKDDDNNENVDYENDDEDSIPEDLYQITEKAIIDVIEAGLKYNKEEDSKFIIDLVVQITNIKRRISIDDKNKYVCFYGYSIFPKEGGKDKFDEKISLYKKWFEIKQPEIFQALVFLYNIYFKYSKYHVNKIVDNETVKLKINKILMNIDNELKNL